MRRSRARTRLGVLAAFAAAAVGLPAVAGTFASSDVKTECAEAGVTGHTGTAKLDIGGAWDFAGVVPPDWTAELSYDVAAGTLQSWTASSPVLAVLMKGGDGLVAYAYDGATSSTTAITTPANSSGNPAGISHITFCLGGGEGDPVPDPDPDPLLPLSLGDASAAGTYVETFAWSIDKSTSTPFAVRSGDTAPLAYEVTVTRTGSSLSDVAVAGSVAVSNPNAVAVELADIEVASPGGDCSAPSSVSVPPGDTSVAFTCTYAGVTSPPLATSVSVTAAGGLGSSATIAWDGDEVHAEVTVVDSFDGADPVVLDGTTYERSAATPASEGCRTVDNVATIVGDVGAVLGSDRVTATACRQAITAGGFTIGYWNNKNGKARLAASGRCAEALAPYPASLGTFQCTDLTGSLATFNKAANSKDALLMLRAQMLATVFNVVLDAPVGRAPLGYAAVPSPSGSCTTVTQLLAEAEAAVTTADRATLLAYKDVFDRINNSVQPICA